MNKELLTDKHKQFINLNPWIKDIDFNNVDIIECNEFYLYLFIRSLIENNVIQCNILIDYEKDRYYYNGKHYFTKIRLVNENNKIHDYLRDSNGNILFWCEDKYNQWFDKKDDVPTHDDFIIDEVDKDNLILTYIS